MSIRAGIVGAGYIGRRPESAVSSRAAPLRRRRRARRAAARRPSSRPRNGVLPFPGRVPSTGILLVKHPTYYIGRRTFLRRRFR